eukprot:gnl/MRDRNA2_/MRDRNA2_222852_c0_seq1.p1 gnl/MRDRNA2_/MRDRNA2_222852_c0~~gnl/MRDRNA2_/MRDRNA2_222852_c0_seq1.p1  ORF type:complete len:440 (+),score=41.75 gnl/MRDRNA2_/MRDRNA2_222852_c0_seq1:47-1321(+)
MQLAKPAAGLGLMVLNFIGASSFGTTTYLSLFLAGSFGSSTLELINQFLFPSVFILIVLISGLEMWWYRDPSGKTWYKRYGETPGMRLLWQFMYVLNLWMALYAVLQLSANDSMPPPSDPIAHFVIEGKCVDAPGAGSLCTPDLCEGARTGDVAIANAFCQAHPDQCNPDKVAPYDWQGTRNAYDFAMESCLGTCNCTGPFNPWKQTDYTSTFGCDRTKTCRTGLDAGARTSSVKWTSMRHPLILKVHICCGFLPMIVGALQFNKWIRNLWNHKLHIWLGRMLLTSGLVHMITALMLLFKVFYEGYTHFYDYVAQSSLVFLSIWTVICGSFGFYYVKKKEYAKHATWMIRLMACWVGAPMARTPTVFFELFVAPEWLFACCFWFAGTVPPILAEIYIRKSGRLNDLKEKFPSSNDGYAQLSSGL